jgi:hypothetical protein
MTPLAMAAGDFEDASLAEGVELAKAGPAASYGGIEVRPMIPPLSPL